MHWGYYKLKLFAYSFVTTCWCSVCANANPPNYTQTPHTLTLKLEPIPIQSASFKIAKTTFLPETFEDLGYSSYSSTNDDHNRGENCIDYTLKSCPEHAKCSKCPFDPHKLIIAQCDQGYAKRNKICVPSICQTINPSYEATITPDYICTKVIEYDLTCYKNCRPVNCSAYPISCSATITNALALEVCPDCDNEAANCSTSKCKVAKCIQGYKPSENGSECIPLDDKCPINYFKSCSTGTYGEAKYTDSNTPCYQCQTRTCSGGGLNLNVYWCNSALKCLLPQN